MSNKSIYTALRAAGLTAEGACGLMGNMQAESSMRPNIAQRGMTSLSDAEYTSRADAGALDFVHDAVGYGLCQWTYFSRKQNLLAFARSRGTSVGDEAMQVQFCIQELQREFRTVFQLLCSSSDLYECARIVCIQYERPATNNVEARHAFALEFLAEFSGEPIPEPTPDPEPTPKPTPTIKPSTDVVLLQTAMALDGAWDREIDGLNTPAWRAAFRQFAGEVLGIKL